MFYRYIKRYWRDYIVLGKLLCKLGFHYYPVTHYKDGRKLKWYEFWVDPDEADIYIHCQRCGKI